MSKKTSSMEFDFKEVNNEKLSKECDEIVKNFETTLEKIGHKHSNKKMLWQNIFQNAITDRRNSYIMFNNLYLEVHGNPDQHALHGVTLTKYLERMSKANEQILKLSEQMDVALTDEELEEELLDEDAMYEHLQSLNKGV